MILNEQDIQLLELAATAYGYTSDRLALPDFLNVYAPDGHHGYFNPLDDNNDAFCLAVKLHIAVQYQAPDFRRNWTVVARTFEGVFCSESGDDPYAAARRAITRAAAAIGREMSNG